jgi:hypothetical protein
MLEILIHIRSKKVVSSVLLWKAIRSLRTLEIDLDTLLSNKKIIEGEGLLAHSWNKKKNLA